VVFSTQHSPDQSEIATKMKAFVHWKAIIEEIIKPVLQRMAENTKYLSTPPVALLSADQGDCGSTG
jgi:S-adenosylmethionine synthetase